jgi:hypothetical protein
MRFLTQARALRRVVVAHWHLRKIAGHAVLHFVPLDDVTADRPQRRPVVERPTLCGKHVAHPGEATIQPEIVGCWECALEIARDPRRWDPPRKRVAVTKDGMTWCATCGGVDGVPPGCRCGTARYLRGVLSDATRTVRYRVWRLFS